MTDVSNNIQSAMTNAILHRLLDLQLQPPTFLSPGLGSNQVLNNFLPQADLSDNSVPSSEGPANSTGVDDEYLNFVTSLLRYSEGAQMSRILQNSLLDPSQNTYKYVLSDKGEKTIRIVKYNKSSFKGFTSCPMTLNDFVDDKDIAQLPCGHIFEPDAILKWLKSESARCPVCRKPLGAKEVKKRAVKRRIPRPPSTPPPARILNPRLMLSRLIERQIALEEEEEIQAAIMASLLDITPPQDGGDDIP